VPVGTEVVCLSWPDDNLEPANEPAERVQAYQIEFSAHPKFGALLGPWWEFALAVVLPDLGPLPRKPGSGRYDAHPEPARDTRVYQQSTW
jgi:hypothetical protein